jgi:CHAD domain-containing protein
MARRRHTILDTFDGRIRKAGARLTQSGTDRRTVAWQRRSAGTSLTVSLPAPVSFAWDLADGPLKRALAPIIGVRRLLAQAETEVQESTFDVLDDRNKTIARLRIESGRARVPKERHAWQPLPSVITLSGLRGYEDAYRALVPVLESRPGIEACPEGFDGLTLRQLDALPVPPSPGADLAPTVAAETGARRIHQEFLKILVANEPGVRTRLDTEFLHDFRVAVRRTRSLLGQVRRVFPPDALTHFSTEFSWLGRATGPLRDLDVLVLAVRGQRNRIPDDDFERLTTFLGQAQEREHQVLIEGLDGKRYQRLLMDWTAFLERSTPYHEAASNAGRPLADVVAQRAWRLSRRIARRAETFDDQTPPDRVHEIRLDTKKLRYLVDVAPAFYDAADLQTVLGALKKLQRVLGEFNDARAQEQRLLECASAAAAVAEPLETKLALGRLADRCRERGDRLRGQVGDGLAEFRSRDTQSACRRAFERPVTPESLR